MRFIWPLFRNHAGNLNSCFTEVHEPEMLKMLSELGPNHVVRGKRGGETANWKERKKDFRIEMCAYLLLLQLKKHQNNNLKFKNTQ